MRRKMDRQAGIRQQQFFIFFDEFCKFSSEKRYPRLALQSPVFFGAKSHLVDHIFLREFDHLNHAV